MSEKKVKTYKAEFKESAVKLAVEFDQPVTDTARDLGVNGNTGDGLAGNGAVGA
ncbi:transposase [Thalassotalea sp. G20_0]|uniref:transposase n=1 Tax=Thalassotalea sp. G20_0 TaxID=2821093 RepID=UPI001ADA9C22|nr:transposase [Thalassotalea sp. G20_0]MBO9494467.1 transposase [Thalassotalea sp. G20_0]